LRKNYFKNTKKYIMQIRNTIQYKRIIERSLVEKNFLGRLFRTNILLSFFSIVLNLDPIYPFCKVSKSEPDRSFEKLIRQPEVASRAIV